MSPNLFIFIGTQKMKSLLDLVKQKFTKDINGTRQRQVKHMKYYFFNYMINPRDFDSSLLKIDKKTLTKTWQFIMLVTSQ